MTGDDGGSDSSHARGGEPTGPTPRRRGKRSSVEDEDAAGGDENARKGKMNDSERERVETFISGVSNGSIVVHRGDLARKLQQHVNPKRPREFYEKLVSRRSLNHVLSSFLRPRLPRRRSAAAMRLALEVSAALEQERRPSKATEVRVQAGKQSHVSPPQALSPSLSLQAPTAVIVSMPSTTAALHAHPAAAWTMVPGPAQFWPQGAGAFPQPSPHARMDIHPQYVDARAYEWARTQLHANRARGGGGMSDDAAAAAFPPAFATQGVSFASLYAGAPQSMMMPFPSEEAMRAHANATALRSIQAYAPVHSTTLRTSTMPTFSMAMPMASAPPEPSKQLPAAAALPVVAPSTT